MASTRHTRLLPAHGLRTGHALGVLVLATALLAGCGTSRPGAAPGDAAPPVAEPVLRDAVGDWLGVPHRLGGLDHRGVDCSGFVLQIFRTVYGLQVPRVTEDQARAGTAVRTDALRPGDLVFFRISRKQRHVGIYLSGGEFAHASSSRGVMISHLSEPYWQQRYWTARRLAAAPAAAGPAPTSTHRRGGW